MSDPLLQPFQIRNPTIRNRILGTANAPRYERDGMPDERYRLYHEEKAKGIQRFGKVIQVRILRSA